MLFSATASPRWAGGTCSATDACHAGPNSATLQPMRSEEHTSELQSLMRISYAVFCLKKKNTTNTQICYNSQTTQQTADIVSRILNKTDEPKSAIISQIRLQ